ncbi:MAG TPA: CHASE2 domain-containing protein [Bryobacteraceae bacterium]|nr:CHASE2 domain-containing protein [Bryobacteraceae bacterium]
MRVRRSYWLAVSAAGLFALLASWTPLATQIDNYAADWLFRVHRPSVWSPESAILALDEDSYEFTQGVRNLRAKMAEALAVVAAAKPRVIALDVVLVDAGQGGEDRQLAQSLGAAGPVVLPCELLPGPRWKLPQPVFLAAAAGLLGHVHAEPDADGMSRHMPLEKSGARERHWALSLEAFRIARGVSITESAEGLDVGPLHIPASRDAGRLLRIRYLPPDADGNSLIPHVTLRQVLEDPRRAAVFRDKVVFVGATAQSAARDRMMTPYNTSRPMPGVEIHAHALETLAQGRFFSDSSLSLVLLFTALFTVAAGAVFARWSGTLAYSLGAGLIGLAHALPHLLFLNGIIFPYVAPAAAAWFAVTCAAVFQYFRTREQLAETESERSRYQQAIQFVTHEMRTPLSAIQGSSELMNRYKLTEEKQKQLSRQIHAESKRLAGMIQTFLDVERLSAGQMNLKREPFPIAALVQTCLERVLPVAERKSIAIVHHPGPDASVLGDRELMEYAVYNLLTNAVKYSPAETKVDVSASFESGMLSVSVQDQGIGMSADELKKIGQKFYRTRRAEQSGEVGTGIGLSIVQQIIVHHGGRLQVTSSPGHGSCFTMLVPATILPVPVSPETEK